MLEPPCAAASQGERGQGECTVRSGSTFTQSLLSWPTCHKYLVSLLEDCTFIHILKKALKHNHYWANINMNHQPDDDVKGTRFASSGLVLDRIWWNVVAYPNIHHPRAVRTARGSWIYVPLRTDLDRDFPEVLHVWGMASDCGNRPILCTICTAGCLILIVSPKKFKWR